MHGGQGAGTGDGGFGTGLELPDGLRPETARRVEEALRYAQRVELPSPEGAPRDWVWQSPRFNFLLLSCTMTGVNNPHVATTMRLPEGRHLKLALDMHDCRAALEDSGVCLPFDRFSHVVLELCEPQGPQERFALGLFRTCVDVMEQQMPLAGEGGPACLHERVAACLDGGEFRPRAGYDRACAEELALRIMEQTAGQHVLVSALMRLHAFCQLAPYDIGNAFVGRMVYAQTLREGGMALLAHLPVLRFLRAWRAGLPTAPAYEPPVAWDACVRETRGTREWTRLFEELLRFVAGEAWWLSNKLSCMAERRRRLEELCAADDALNERQCAVLVEAYVHDDAEFTFEGLVREYGVAYSTAHDDLCTLERAGMLAQVKSGRRAYFIAAPDLRSRLLSRLRLCAPERFDELFFADGRLRGVTVGPWRAEDALRPATCLVDGDGERGDRYPRVERERRLLITKPRRH